MRRAVLVASFCVLVGALIGWWNWRYERVERIPAWCLSDGPNVDTHVDGCTWLGESATRRLRLEVQPGQAPRAIRWSIPGIPAVEALHLRFRIAAAGMVAGRQKWQDGRLFLEWEQGRNAPEKVYLGSIRHSDQGDWQELVVSPTRGTALPMLRMEHLGVAGAFELTGFEATAVRERPYWKTGAFALAGAWFCWFLAWIPRPSGSRHWRRFAAAGIMLGMGWFFVVPGPWAHPRPLVAEFHFKSRPEASAAMPPNPTQAPPTVEIVPPPAEPRLAAEGNWILRVKYALEPARPGLHILLLFFPCAVLVRLTRPRLAVAMGTLLALAIEAAQTAFGYGFDWLDIADLLSDAIGIALAVALAVWAGRPGVSAAPPGESVNR